MNQFVPWLYQSNPGWRIGWGVLVEDQMVAFRLKLDEAREVMRGPWRAPRLAAVSNQIGTDDYMILPP